MRSRLRALAGATVLAVATATVGVAGSGPASAQPGAPAWLALVNAYRAAAGLPPVVEEPSWTRSVAAHANYMVLNRSVTHRQNSSLPGASAEGDLAARNSVLSFWSDNRDDRTLIEMWMSAPFHLFPIIEPRLQKVAFASARDVPGSSGGSSAALDIGRGRGPRVTVSDAVLFPGPGSSVPVSTFSLDSPDPLSACPGWTAPAGLPILALLPAAPGADVSATVQAGSQNLEVCIITPTTYRNGNATVQQTGRAILTEKNGVIVIPRAPLTKGEYSVTLRGAKRTWTWTFSVTDPGSDVGPARALKITPRRR